MIWQCDGQVIQVHIQFLMPGEMANVLVVPVMVMVQAIFITVAGQVDRIAMAASMAPIMVTVSVDPNMTGASDIRSIGAIYLDPTTEVTV